jgi:hypothetical protein
MLISITGQQVAGQWFIETQEGRRDAGDTHKVICVVNEKRFQMQDCRQFAGALKRMTGSFVKFGSMAVDSLCDGW